MQYGIFRNLALISALALPFGSLEAQQSFHSSENPVVKPTPPAASAPTSVPALIPYSGFGVGADGKAIIGEAAVTFLIYKDEVGGNPLFTESQTAAFDATGHYAIQLGATLSSGIPIDLFGTGEARWLEVQIAGAKTQPRALLVSVPYALKAGDASTLGGLPASAYALAGTSQRQAVSNLATIAAPTPSVVTPSAVSNVTTTGGTSGYLPLFSGTSTVVNSILYQSSTGVGIGDTPNSAYKLDVNGKSILRGAVNLPNNGVATTSAGTSSFPLTFNASVYNSSTKANAFPIYYFQAEPQNNNSSSPGATLNLLYNNNNGVGTETGIVLNANGTIKFGPGQTFAATGGIAFNGTSSSGLGVEGTSTSGSGVQGNSTSSNGVYGKSTSGDGLQGLTAGTTIHTAGVFGVAGTGNTSNFTGIAGVWGDANAHVGVLGTSTQYSGVQGLSETSFGVQGTSNSSYGVIGGTNANSGAGAGVYGYSNAATPGVKGASQTSDGGDFYGGGSGSGVEGFGGSSNGSSIPGIGGIFTGGTGYSDNITGGAGLYAVGGTSGSGGGGNAGVGIEATGGYSDGGSAEEGGIFNGGSSNSGFGGSGLVASPGYSLSNGYGSFAAQFNGSIDINGTTHSNVVSQTMDHPLDPANKYLNHAAIQSSEMVNMYSGNVVTDDQGMATVQLPSWFETVNGDLRYQLTTVGHKGQAWIAEEVKEGKFQIASDMANVKISWQITGVRQDAYAKAHPLVVEEVKNARERGFYKNPELYGQPAEKQTLYARSPSAMRAIQQARLKKPVLTAAPK